MSGESFRPQKITNLDLALYAEGLLSSERAAEVRIFLAEHPEFEVLVSNADSSPISELDVTAFPELPGAGGERQRFSSGDSDLSTLETVRVRSKSSWSSSNQRRWAAAMLTALVILLLGWRQAELYAWDYNTTLGRLWLTATASDLPQVVVRSRQALESLGGGLWVSSERRSQRNLDLARVLLTQAELEKPQYIIHRYCRTPAELPPLQLAERAIQLLADAGVKSREFREVQTGALRVRGELEFEMGMAFRGQRLHEESKEWLYRSVVTLLQGIEAARASQDYSAELRISARLVKAIHKGAVSEGQLIQRLLLWVEGAELPPVFAEIQRLFPECEFDWDQLRDRLSRNALKDPGYSSAYAEGIGTLNRAVCRQMLRQPPVSIEDAISFMDICNTVGLQYHTVRDPYPEVLPALDSGIELGRSLLSNGVESPDLLMILLRLQGNLADTHRHWGNRPAAIEARREAIDNARKLLVLKTDSEVRNEMGWLVGRQVQALFLDAIDTGGSFAECDRMLGAIQQLTGDFASFAGFQLNTGEEELIREIDHFRSEKMESPPEFSDLASEFDVVMDRHLQEGPEGLLQQHLRCFAADIQTLLRVREFAASEQLQRIAKRLQELQPEDSSNANRISRDQQAEPESTSHSRL